MNINAAWADCSIKDFVTLNRDEYETLNHLLSDHLCSTHTDEDEKKLNTLQAKLIFIIHNTH